MRPQVRQFVGDLPQKSMVLPLEVMQLLYAAAMGIWISADHDETKELFDPVCSVLTSAAQCAPGSHQPTETNTIVLSSTQLTLIRRNAYIIAKVMDSLANSPYKDVINTALGSVLGALSPLIVWCLRSASSSSSCSSQGLRPKSGHVIGFIS